jgi:hypothetical protein
MVESMVELSLCSTLISISSVDSTMTPTLFGRWQTRLLLLATIGVVITSIFSWLFTGNGWHLPFFQVLAYVALFGIGWDAIYHGLQQYRWDHDWPAVFQLIAGIWEGVWIAVLFKTVGLPGVDRLMPLNAFWLHYSLVWLGYFGASQMLMRILFPRWRFRGGQWWGRF